MLLNDMKGGEAMGDRLAKWLYDILDNMPRRPNGILSNSAVREDLRTLEPAGNIPKRQKEFVLNKLSLCSMVVIAGVVLSVLMWINESNNTQIVDNRLYRNEYGEGSQTVNIVADNGEDTYEINLELLERGFTQDEVASMVEKFIPVLEASVLGQNENLDNVKYDLNLVDSVNGYPFDVEWSMDDKYITSEGILVNDKLDAPKVVELEAKISYESFEMVHIFSCNVHTKAIQPTWQELLVSEIYKDEEATRKDEYMTLPSQNGQEEINWSYKRSWNGLLFLIATPIVAAVIYYSKDRDLHKLVKDREEQMKLDYPDIVSSLALLIGAGMTVTNAWKKIVNDYCIERKETGIKRYAYEEMLITVYEMDNGVMQTKAFERFGRRCRISSYNKLATMLSQNIRKGASNLTIVLKEEATESFNERKHTARQLGEKAGTKLLMPMMMHLAIVMVIIMIPAFIGFL